jgi:DNA-binding GntR family transcriptional regulator
MAKRLPVQPLEVAPLDRAGADPLHQQVYERLRTAIVAGGLPIGARLPSTRTLAADWGVTRGTVLTAVDRLLAEGYVTGAPGSGTYVAGVVSQDHAESAGKAVGGHSRG